MNPPVAQPDQPTPRDQIAGLNFALLLVGPDLTVREVNPAAENLLGISAKRLIGAKLLEVLGLGEGRLGRTVADGETQLVARGLELRIGARRLKLNLTLSPMPLHPGWRVVTLSDAGQGERLGEEERRPTLRGPAVLAHEIKNPLAAIRGAAQLLQRKAAPGEQAMTGLITDEVDRIAALIDRMQRLGRQRAEPIEPLNLHEAVHRALSTVRLSSPARINWREEFDPSLPPVLANEGALVQVLVNLMSNARDACSANSANAARPQVVLRTRFVSGLAMSVMRSGRPVRLPIEVQVSDNGPGIDPALGDEIFEPFVSSKPHGQGLGLALVQKLVRDMDGRVSHSREDGSDGSAGWTHFRVHLPVAR